MAEIHVIFHGEPTTLVSTDHLNGVVCFQSDQDITGQVNLQVLPSSVFEHKGVKIELIGSIEFPLEYGNVTNFLSLTQHIASPERLEAPGSSYSFSFLNTTKPYESYYGHSVKLRYFLRVTVARLLHNLVGEKEFFVQCCSSSYSATKMSSLTTISLEVPEQLRLDFQLHKTNYHLEDAIEGIVYFHIVKVSIVQMELHIIQRECLGRPSCIETKTLARYQLMDGCPINNEKIPFRLFLRNYALVLTPTMKDVNQKFSVRYCVSLVILDEGNRRYSKQKEIFIFRQAPQNIQLGAFL